jgi:hypothetical protein
MIVIGVYPTIMERLIGTGVTSILQLVNPSALAALFIR